MNSTELLWFKFVVLFVSIFILVISIISAAYFNKIRLNENTCSISVSTATTLVWLNITVAILSSILLLWVLFRLIFSGDKDTRNINKIYNNYETTETVNSPL